MIPLPCANRILEMGGEGPVRQAFLNLFNAMSDSSDLDNLPSATLVIPFYDEACNLQPGDWAPEIHLLVRKVDHVETKDADPGSRDQVDDQTTEEGTA